MRNSGKPTRLVGNWSRAKIKADNKSVTKGEERGRSKEERRNERPCRK
jgi:hypothetical protein